MKHRPENSQLEFSHVIPVDKIPAQGMVVELSANDQQRADLAKRFALQDLTSLSAKLTINPARDGAAFSVRGDLLADVVQSCVVTLEPVPAHVHDDLSVLFTDLVDEDGLEHADFDGDDLEVLVNGKIDLGELLAQHLGVALDPYPRKAGVDFDKVTFGTADSPVNPWAKLVELKKKS